MKRRRMKKLTVSMLMTLFLCFNAFSVHASENAETIESINSENEVDLSETISYGEDSETTKSGKCGDNAYWTLSDDGTFTITGSGAMYDYEFIGGSEAGSDSGTNTEWAKQYLSDSIKRLVVEEGITSIGDHTFQECHNLAQIDLPNGIKKIGIAAFWNCALESVVVPDTVTKISGAAFDTNKSLKSVVLPNSLETIEIWAFLQCPNLEDITIPISVEIGENVFDEDAKFKNIHITKGDGIGFAYNTANYNRTPWYISQSNNPTITIDDDIEYIGAYTFYRNKALTELRLPSKLIGIGEGAFYSCTNLKEVVIPCGVSIKEDTFIGCKYIDKIHTDCDGNGVCEKCNVKFAQNVLKGTCQIPYGMIKEGEGGYLIGCETNDNPRQKYRYELLILDCTKLINGEDAWIYTTGDCTVAEGNAMWTVWQPQYGYYWTLFRIYDNAGNIIEQQCYGFANVI